MAKAWRHGSGAPRSSAAPPRSKTRLTSGPSRASTAAENTSVKLNHVARPQPPRRLGECLPASVGSLPVQRELDSRLAPHAHQTRRNHPRVVEDHQVSRPQQGRKVGHSAMGEAGGEIQEARGIARTGGARRDRLAREVEIEGVDPHRWLPAPPASGLTPSRTARRGGGRSSARRSSRRRRRGRQSP